MGCSTGTVVTLGFAGNGGGTDAGVGAGCAGAGFAGSILTGGGGVTLATTGGEADLLATLGVSGTGGGPGGTGEFPDTYSSPGNGTGLPARPTLGMVRLTSSGGSADAGSGGGVTTVIGGTDSALGERLAGATFTGSVLAGGDGAALDALGGKAMLSATRAMAGPPGDPAGPAGPTETYSSPGEGTGVPAEAVLQSVRLTSTGGDARDGNVFVPTEPGTTPCR